MVKIMLWQLLFIPTPTPLPEFILSIPGDPESHIWGRLSPNQSPETIQNTASGTMLGKMWLALGILSYFWALMVVPEAPNV